MHSRRRFIRNLDRQLQYALGYDVHVGGGRRLCADEDAVLRMRIVCRLLKLLLKRAQPLSNQVDVLSINKQWRLATRSNVSVELSNKPSVLNKL